MKEYTEKQLKKDLGARVKAYRELNNYSQEQFAELLNTSPSAISALERGISFPIPSKLAALINLLNITPSDLFSFSNQKRTNKTEKFILGISEKMRKELSDEQIEILFNVVEQFTISK